MRRCRGGWQRVLSCCLSSHHLPLPSQMNPDYVNRVKNATRWHPVLIWRTRRGQSVISRTASSAEPQLKQEEMEMMADGCYCVPPRTERQRWEEEDVRTRSLRKMKCHSLWINPFCPLWVKAERSHTDLAGDVFLFLKCFCCSRRTDLRFLLCRPKYFITRRHELNGTVCTRQDWRLVIILWHNVFDLIVTPNDKVCNNSNKTNDFIPSFSLWF